MVVMAILAILSSLTLAGLLGARERSKEAKTRATIRKLSELILPYYEEYETRRPVLDPTAVARMTQDRTPANRRRLANYKQIALRRLMALELPDRVSDITDALESTFDPQVDGNPTPLTEIPPVTRRYDYILTGIKSITSSDLLHLIVTRGVVADPDIIAHFRDDEAADTNGNGLKEFVDGWGTPIAFKRWPVGFASPLQPITGTLQDVEPLFSDYGHRLVPLIYSAGRDKSYDIDASPDVGYRIAKYDPFNALLRKPPTGVKGEVVLVPIIKDSTEVFAALRYDGSPLPAGAFQTIGSPRDTGSATGDEPNQKLESADNIHNHDLRL
jgi:type II secretory pathway pseudopilin PulG